jgi:hypothetical protein
LEVAADTGYATMEDKEMTSMKKLIVLLVTVFMSCPFLSLAADGEPKGGNVDGAGTTVKSSKSNSSDRGSGSSGDAATSVKSGKSNSSDRGKGGTVDAAGTTVKSSKSNSSE